MGLLVEYCCLLKLGVVNKATCASTKMRDSYVTEALGNLLLCHLRFYCMKSGNYLGASLTK
jgi:hypothetical protein